MIKIENTEVHGFEAAIRGARNPYDSWDKSDSHKAAYPDEDVYIVGDKDKELLLKLAKAGGDHGKALRMINVTCDITAPLYWWKEADTYKVGTVRNSCSTMTRLMSKPFSVEDFSFEHLIGNVKKKYYDVEVDEKLEIWRDCVESPDYKVSNYGRVFSKKSNKMLSPCVNSSNYKKCMMNKTNYYVHRLVANAFIDNPDNLPEINHIDGNKWNNKVDNLEWVTRSGNAVHAFETGLRTIDGYTRYKVAKRTHRFSDEEVKTIFELYESGMTKQEIADKFGCYSSLICNILNKKQYNPIDLKPYDLARIIVDYLNELRELYLKTKDKSYWYTAIQILPTSYNQRSTWQANYQVLRHMYHARKNHRLNEWHDFCRWVESLPYSELITEV